MILGTGIDIIEVARVQGSVERFGDRFLKRVLLPDEIAYCQQHKSPGPFIAARFAAIDLCFRLTERHRIRLPVRVGINSAGLIHNARI